MNTTSPVNVIIRTCDRKDLLLCTLDGINEQTFLRERIGIIVVE